MKARPDLPFNTSKVRLEAETHAFRRQLNQLSIPQRSDWKWEAAAICDADYTFNTSKVRLEGHSVSRILVISSTFNTSKVRLEGASTTRKGGLSRAFNTSKVRLEGARWSGRNAGSTLSIPQRSDWKASDLAAEMYGVVFQYLKGPIGRRRCSLWGTTRALSIPQRSDWKVEVRLLIQMATSFQYLKGPIGSGGSQEMLCVARPFNTSKVRLEEAWSWAPDPSFFLSIPQRSDWKPTSMCQKSAASANAGGCRRGTGGVFVVGRR